MATQRQFRSDDTSTWFDRFGTGGDGVWTVSTATDAPIDSACAGTAGATSLSATNASFTAGQALLIIQMTGTGAGSNPNWELNRVAAYITGTITTAYPLTLTYSAGAQVIVLKQYSSVSLANGVTLTGKAWNGTVGGIVAWLCNGTTTLDGSIVLTGTGYRAGSGTSLQNASPAKGFSGEGTGGAVTQQTSANGNGGGGGEADSSAGSSAPGGGGGNGTAGTAGSSSISSAVVGAAGNAISNAGITILTLGGGGGGGGVSDSNTKPVASGGAGAGALIVISRALTITSTAVISMSGSTGGSVGDKAGAGGGGAGGTALFKGQTLDVGTSRFTASGGSGGAGSGGGPGGTGGVGRIHADYLTSLAGTTTPTLDSRLDFSLADPTGGSFLFNML